MGDNQTMDDIAEFVAALLHSGTITHFMHLSTNSYARHVALGDYYEEIIELADKYAEACMGRYEKIMDWPTEFHSADDPIEYLEKMQQFVAESREHLPKDTELQNIIDEIADLINSTLYKLHFLE